jgi:ElaB/YqjD/DUF883 family membrane-anchored ribosome-binding protein
MDCENQGSTDSGNTPAPVADEPTGQQKGLGAQAGAAFSKVNEAAREAGSHVKESVTALAAEAGGKAKGFIDRQVDASADLLESIGRSANAAADTLNSDAPQLAGFVRGVATSVKDLSGGVRGQSPEALLRTASSYVRENPALALSAAAACGFALARLLQGGASKDSRSAVQAGITQATSRPDAF